MNKNLIMLLENNNYNRNALLDKTVLLTGGGGGIGFEAARAFSYMGAKVIIAEIDVAKGEQAQTLINGEFGSGSVDFFQTDLADEKQIDALCEYIMDKYSRLDIIVNNAAVVPMGAVEAVPIDDWDLSYAVNLRAPVLLTQKFLPAMKKAGGIIVFNPSSPGAYMSAYEIFKTAQVELCNALAEEVADTPIITYGITPGFVKTETSIKAVETVAASMGITADEFSRTLNDVAIDVENAGTGYAVSVVNAEKYNGQITSSYQALLDAGLIENETETNVISSQADYAHLSSLFNECADIFYGQYKDWQKKNVFQKKFALSHFKKITGLSADDFKRRLEILQSEVQNGDWMNSASAKELFVKLQDFYRQAVKMLASFEKDPAQLKSDTALLNEWISTLQKIIGKLS
jgi:NAD(P)-dependent dehydrogenase (short-subunit alcohol dehydrogenase family)